VNPPVIPSASLLLLRAEPFSVLMAKRHAALAFGASHWVFPGGRIDTEDHVAVAGNDTDPLAAARHAALREAREEADMQLDMASSLPALVPLARWIAPAGTTRRFDTWFFLGEAPPAAVPRADGSEIVEVAFVEPAAMLLSMDRGEIDLLPPTVLNLRWLAAAGSVQVALSRAAAREAPCIQPEYFQRDGEAHIRICQDSGYDITEYRMPWRKPARQGDPQSNPRNEPA
jgi:8-oxo-dGTP pyrophosphatase MutT (NUDIX family)